MRLCGGTHTHASAICFDGHWMTYRPSNRNLHVAANRQLRVSGT